MTSAPYTPPPPRPFGQSAIAILLLLNAFICLVYSLAIYAAEKTLHLDLVLPIALLFSLNPPLALASVASPILIFRRSALGLILAWSIQFALFLDLILSLPATLEYAPMFLKIPLDLALLTPLAIFLIKRATYKNLNPTSYGFPVIVRALGAPLASPLASSQTPLLTPNPITSPPYFPLPTAQNTFDAQVAQNIKEARMQSYVRTANILRTIAFITRIVALILLVLSFASVLLEFYVLMQELFPSGIGFSGRGTDTSVMLITAVAINFIPFLLLIILLIATYLLTALAELLRCQATKAT